MALDIVWMILFSVGGGLALLFFLGRRNESAVKRDWELLLTPKGRQLYGMLETRTRTDLDMADMAYAEAFAARELGSTTEALQLLRVGYQVIERFAPDMIRLLAAMATFSRMVSAMAPAPPLRPRDFRVAQLASLAYLNGMLHQFLVSTGERFRLKAYILAQSFGLATRFLMRSTESLVTRRSDDEREWQQIEAINADLKTLTEESLGTLHALLTSLAAEHRDDVLARLR